MTTAYLILFLIILSCDMVYSKKNMNALSEKTEQNLLEVVEQKVEDDIPSLLQELRVDDSIFYCSDITTDNQIY